MSIDKWIPKKGSKENRRREEAFNKLSTEEVQELKKKKVRALFKKKVSVKIENSELDEFLQEIVEFNAWINRRTYLKGDLDKIEMWVRNLYSKIISEPAQESIQSDYSEKRKIIDEYKRIPLQLLDEKIRIAINKKIHGGKKTSSDNYYLRKLKTIIQDKLTEAKYYEILDKILKL